MSATMTTTRTAEPRKIRIKRKKLISSDSKTSNMSNVSLDKNPCLTLDDVPMKAIFEGGSVLAESITSVLREFVRYVMGEKNKGYWYSSVKLEKGNISYGVWSSGKFPTLLLSNLILKRICKEIAVCGANSDLKKELDKEYNKYKHLSTIKPLVEFLEEVLRDDDFESTLDTSIDMFAFRNGILCLRTGKFRKGIHPNDYLSRTLDYDYNPKPNEEHKSYLLLQFKRICNNKDHQLEFYLTIIALALCGQAECFKKFVQVKGEGGANGKSVIFDALCCIFPIYFQKLGSSDLEAGKENARNKIIPNWRGKRGLFLNEPTKTPQDSAFLKNLRDMENMMYNKLYGNQRSVLLRAVLFVCCNYAMKMDVKGDNGLNRSFVVTQHESKWVDEIDKDDDVRCRYVRDYEFSTKLKTTYRDALVSIFIDYAYKFYQSGKKIPSIPREWADETNAVKEQDDEQKKWFEENYEECSYGKTYWIDFQTDFNKEFDLKYNNEEAFVEFLKRIDYYKGYYNRDMTKTVESTRFCMTEKREITTKKTYRKGFKGWRKIPEIQTDEKDEE